MILIENTQWICPPDLIQETDSYWEVRCGFDCPQQMDCWLEIAADARYAAWVNGHFVGAGPYQDWPQTRSVDRWKINEILRENVQNELLVLVHRIGEATFSHVPGDAGVAFLISDETGSIVASGTDCEWRPSPHYQSGTMPRITMQLGFGFDYDAVGTEAEWQPITENDCRSLPDTGREFRMRPVPSCELIGRTRATVIAQGVFRKTANTEGRSLAWRMQRDWLSFREAAELFDSDVQVPRDLGMSAPTFSDVPSDADGAWIVIDLGRESVGFLELEITAPGPALLEIAWGQHLDDLRVRSQVGERYFASSYRCCPGHQIFREPLTRIGGRFLQIHLSGELAGMVLHYAGLRESLYPTPQPIPCPSPDALDFAIYDLCVRTLHLCMGDHYEDTPWREQALYANDALNQSLAGYAVFGETQYAQASLDLLGGGLREDGFLELCAPAKIPITIPAFSFAWVLAVWKNVEFSGDVEFARAQIPRVSSILDQAVGRMSQGLLPCPTGPGYWHFYDWTAGGLDGTVEGDATQFAVLDHPRYDAPLNAFLILALEAGPALARGLGDSDKADQWTARAGELRQNFLATFRDENADLFRSFEGRETQHPPCELVQALSLLAGCCPPQHIAALAAKVLEPARSNLIPASLSQSFYSFQALLPQPEFHAALRERIRRVWGPMITQGATACWETGDAGWAFDRAGSLCHGWSAIPAYVMHRIYLSCGGL